MPTAARLPLPVKPIKAKDTTIRPRQTVAEGVKVETTYLIVYLFLMYHCVRKYKDRPSVNITIQTVPPIPGRVAC